MTGNFIKRLSLVTRMVCITIKTELESFAGPKPQILFRVNPYTTKRKEKKIIDPETETYKPELAPSLRLQIR